MLERLVRPRRGRPAPLYQATKAAVAHKHAPAQVRELMAGGMTMQQAVATIAPRWQLTAKQLASIWWGKSGHARKLRRSTQ